MAERIGKTQEVLHDDGNVATEFVAGAEQAPQPVVDTAQEFLRAAGVDPSRVNYSVHLKPVETKDDDGNVVGTTYKATSGWAKSTRPAKGDAERELLETYAHYTTPPSPRISPVRTSSYRTGKRDKIGVILPDTQFGYRYVDGIYVPIHDPRALNVARQVIRCIGTELDLVVHVGDALDYPHFGKHDDDPATWNTTQKTNADFQREVTAGAMRADAPNAKSVWLEGNHEKRRRVYVEDKAPHLVGERVVNPDGSPGELALSLANVFSLGKLGIDYIEGYPNNWYRINDRLMVIHGSQSNVKGSTVHGILHNTAHPSMSVISGHTHRAEKATKTIYLPDGTPRTVQAESFGTLADIRGAVPAGNMGRTMDNLHTESLPNWQQGLGIVYYREGDAPFKTEFVPIHTFDGHEALFDGKVFTPTVDEYGNPL
ncbi:hypothetical protein L336_0755 [Candidatus Saccharimonas aalborgensis]|uniref:Calcineurin-like phosphoesterase domain-containing protein n=1 Tax=Candidatus Saccharimonas aalborgensis TaxID=1332188 RepID=R4PXG4_9BACT|nr:hypothetical protein [Candidatus Saccharimonas aalborgensis]AGL62457.1 hypothetical protein L336_0755 [Candidatus Saccharimonas aalborgensis]QQS67959.1 MAG: hypothetical protein IPP24_02985 [Candidatus Saccharibacteria bacterium]QQS70300.1 MAG: hypothetical protein IPP92_03115 [Candidatus Saccharibacteria bacterium]